MRIAWGVMGYGRGHAMRTLSVLPEMMKEHEITVFTAGDAHDVLAPHFPTVKIPMIGYRYNDRGSHSVPRTIGGNVSVVSDLMLGGAGMASIKKEFTERGIQLVISDSEAYTHRVAQRMRIPRISFDHVGILAYCKPHFPSDLWLAGMRDAVGYRTLMGIPERILISSFYQATPAYPGVRIVGPMLREAVLKARPVSGDYLMCYFNKGEHQYQPHIDRALRLLDIPVVVYGTPYVGRSDNLDFRPPSNDQFVKDMAGCRAILSTAGNQTIGEAVHLGKPILALPENAFEQRLNAHIIETMGVGCQADLGSLTPSDVDRFLGYHDHYVSHMTARAGDGRAEAIETLHRFIGELVGKKSQATRPRLLRRPQWSLGATRQGGIR